MTQECKEGPRSHNRDDSPDPAVPGPELSRCCQRAESLFDPALFKALGDPTRLAVLFRLMEMGGPRPVTEVGGCCTVDLSVVSRHLAALRQAGVVEAERQGREVRYRVRYGALARTLRRMAEAIEACCPETPTLTEESST